jgi:hypothetical protein
MSLETWNDVFLWASTAFAVVAALSAAIDRKTGLFRWASMAFAVLAALSTGGAITTGHAIDRKKDEEIAAVQSRHITKEQREQLIALLKPVEKAPVFFNPLMTDGEAIQFSDEIKIF